MDKIFGNGSDNTLTTSKARFCATMCVTKGTNYFKTLNLVSKNKMMAYICALIELFKVPQD